MKFPLYLLLLTIIAVVGVYAGSAQKAIIVSYPNDTPDSVITEAMDVIKKAVRGFPRLRIRYGANPAAGRSDYTRVQSHQGIRSQSASKGTRECTGHGRTVQRFGGD